MIYYIARYTSHPTRLYKDCLLYALRHLYGNRHIGLTLGGTGGAQLQAEMHAVSPREDDKYRTATHADSGFAVSQALQQVDIRKTWETPQSIATADSTT